MNETEIKELNYFAGLAMQAIIMKRKVGAYGEEDLEYTAKWAYQNALAMVAQRKKTLTPNKEE